MTTRRRVHVSLTLAAVLATTVALPAPASSSTGSVERSAASATLRAVDPGTDYSSVVTRLRHDIPRAMAASRAVGLTIALVDGDRVVWTEGFGYADRAKARRVTPDTLFHIGSLSKTFSAVAVMQLVERGLVDLDAPLSRYVRGFSLRGQPAGTVTVREVLDHHSGIPGDVFNGLITYGAPDPGFRAWLLGALRSMYPENPPRTVQAYNNSGYVLLQNLVERVTGQPFEAYTQRALFAPMAMPSSHFDDRLAPVARLTRNYALSAEGKAVVRPREYVNGWTAGSITSSARDMANYLRTLLAGGRGPGDRVLGTATLRQMWTPQDVMPLDIAPFPYGLGFLLRDPALEWAGPVVWHDGATAWNMSMLKLLPRQGLGVFVSTNTATDVTEGIAAEALTLAVRAKTGLTPPPDAALPTSEPKQLPPSWLTALAGDYAGMTSIYRLTTDGASLTLVRDPGTAFASTPTTLHPSADGWFRDEANTLQVQVRTVEGRRLLVTRAADGGAVVTMVAGQRVPDGPAPSAWLARLGTYRAVDAVPNVDSTLVARSVVLRTDGRLLISEQESLFGRQALAAGPAGSVCTFGLGRRKGDCLVPFTASGGAPGFRFMGVRYVRVAS